jgi:preprotein translocase subunit SecD
MRKVLVLIGLFLVCHGAMGQNSQIDTVRWVQSNDVLFNPLKNGQYLVMELPEEHKELGFIDAITKKSFLIGRSEFFAFSDIDTVYSYFDPNFKANVVDVLFNETSSERLLEFTMKWKGYKVGLVVNNKLIYTATLDISPISNGKMSLIGPPQAKELDALVNSIKTASLH